LQAIPEALVRSQTLVDTTPPQDLDAEQACIGCCLLDAAAADLVMSTISASDFYREAHRQIFDATASLHQQGQPVDIITISSELRRRGELEQVGGAEYLMAIIAQVPTSAHA
jgi:replicative DNA helicase